MHDFNDGYFDNYRFDAHRHTLRRELADRDTPADHCIECDALLTAANDGGGIEIEGEGWICTACDAAYAAADARDAA